MKFIAGAAALAAAALVSTGASAAVTVYSENFDGYDLSGLSNGATGAGPSSTSGNSFTTEYQFRTGATNTGADSLYDEGTWTINTNPINVHNLFVDLGPSTNNMLILNGKTSADLANPAHAWVSDAFAVNAGSYTFSFDLMNVCCNANHPSNLPSVLWFYYTTDAGSTYLLASGPANTPGSPGTFVSQSGAFNLASSGTLKVAIFDTNGAANGNDFAVDNIRVAYVPEPGAWALMILGFGASGAALRRRRAAVAA